MKSILIIISIFVWSLNYSFGQELNATINVTSTSKQNMQIDKSIFENLELSLMDFINGTKWTEHNYEVPEKIECSFSLNITSASGSNFSGTLTLQSNRPIYNSTYSSPIYNLVDNDISFNYIDNQSLEFNENSYTSNLTSLFAFYIYMIIGSDYDTFSPLGGTPYFTKAFEVVQNAAVIDGPIGWKSSQKGRKNRFWLSDHMLASNFELFRILNYKYHRLGLDIMHKDPEKGRTEIIEILKGIKQIHSSEPSSYLLRVFFDGKSSEIIKIIKEHPKSELTELVQTLSKADIKNASKYEAILE